VSNTHNTALTKEPDACMQITLHVRRSKLNLIINKFWCLQS
jgi:hypothetical protein